VKFPRECHPFGSYVVPLLQRAQETVQEEEGGYSLHYLVQSGQWPDKEQCRLDIRRHQEARHKDLRQALSQ